MTTLRNRLWIDDLGRSHVLIVPAVGVCPDMPTYRDAPVLIRTERLHVGEVIRVLSYRHGPYLRAGGEVWARALTYTTTELLAADMGAEVLMSVEEFDAAAKAAKEDYAAYRATWPAPKPRKRKPKADVVATVPAAPAPATMPDWASLSDEEYAARMRGWQRRHGLSLVGAARALGVGKKAAWMYLQGTRRPTLDVPVGLAMAHYDEHPELLKNKNPVRWPSKAA